ncbi:hypothetical protein M405DRAFT_938635, partial [Rhizopogon salebrosus TDB-379]
MCNAYNILHGPTMGWPSLKYVILCNFRIFGYLRLLLLLQFSHFWLVAFKFPPAPPAPPLSL